MENYFSKIHPITIFIFLIVEFVYIVITGYNINILPILVILLLTELTIKGACAFRNSVLLTLVLMVAFAVFNCIFYHVGENVFLYVNDIPLTLDACIYGLFMGAVVATLTVWFKLFSEFLGSDGLIFLISRPFPTVALIVSMIFCYYEKFVGKLDKIKEAQFAFEAEQSLLRKTGRNFNVLLAVMLEDSVVTAKSMRARAYGKCKRTFYNIYIYSAMDAVILLALILLVVLDILLPINNVFTSVIFMMPVLFNTVKELKWKYYLSKI